MHFLQIFNTFQEFYLHLKSCAHSDSTACLSNAEAKKKKGDNHAMQVMWSIKPLSRRLCWHNFTIYHQDPVKVYNIYKKCKGIKKNSAGIWLLTIRINGQTQRRPAIFGDNDRRSLAWFPVSMFVFGRHTEKIGRVWM